MNSLVATIPAQSDFTSAAPVRPVVQPETSVSVRRLPWGRILGGTALLAAIGTALGSYVYHAAGLESTDDSFLEGNVHPVSPRINGTVSRVLVDDNAHVEAGQPLVELDPADLNLTAQGAEADLAQARATATQVTAQIARAQADLEAATARIAQNAAQLKRAELDFRRMAVLGADNVGAISKQDLESSRAQFDAAQATQQSLIAEKASAEAGLAAVQSQSAVALAQIQKAESTLGIARLQAGYTVVRAPSAGRVARKSVEVGQRLQPGQPVMSVVSDDVWIVANFKENQLAQLRTGEKVEVKVDALPGQVFQGVIDSFSPGTGAKFSLLPPDNATGNFTKVVQRVPVKIVFAAGSLGSAVARLAPGLSAGVTVSIRE